ncbi:hypothetical protein H8711_00660 [Clostridiaceae bacterium NSJ-31]|uniref:Cohesin domain-containing protein n=1 Tax=Ligaoa zhengdingensis TaxID=2763658 RepID=A0A926I3E8_9FIRM|nr:cohesin domain-containing protein [Ligaoa zhengdingensis]MBC8545448.1 hypothetical protein [Ligaoa zhengdingensis]
MSEQLTKKRIIAIIVGVVAVLAVAAVAFGFLRSGSDPASSGPKAVVAGQKVAVTVAAPSVEDLYGYQFRLNFDESKFEYKEELTSEIDEISSIFAKPFDGYQLVGATMIGETPGFSGKKVDICKMVFEAKVDTPLSEATFSISDVNIVKSNLDYEENVDGWQMETAVVDG